MAEKKKRVSRRKPKKETIPKPGVALAPAPALTPSSAPPPQGVMYNAGNKAEVPCCMKCLGCGVETPHEPGQVIGECIRCGGKLFKRARVNLSSLPPVKCPRCGSLFWTKREYDEHACDEKTVRQRQAGLRSAVDSSGNPVNPVEPKQARAPAGPSGFEEA